MADKEAKREEFREGIPEWSNDLRMEKLLGPLPPSRDLDRDNWDNTIKFWERVIFDSCRHFETITISVEDLKATFTRKGIVPMCLENVLIELIQQQKLTPIDKYKNGETKGWFGSIVSWGWSKLVESEPTLPTGPYIYEAFVKEKGDALVEEHHKEALFPTDHVALLHEVSVATGFTEEELELVGIYLAKSNKAAVFSLGDGKKAIKFARKGEYAKPVEITEADRGIVQLKHTYDLLNKQEEKLEQDIKECERKAVEFNRNKKKTQALTHLRRKKMLQGVLEKRRNSAQTIRDILDTIEKTQTDKEIFEQYQLGVATLKEIQEKSGVTVEAVDQVMEEMQELLLNQQEVDDAFKIGSEQLSVEAEAELEDELNALIAETEAEKKVPQKPLAASEEDREMEEMIKAMENASLTIKSLPLPEATTTKGKEKEREKETEEALLAI